MKKLQQRKMMTWLAAILVGLLIVGVVGFAQGNQGENGAGYGKTPDEPAEEVEEHYKEDGRAAQGLKDPGPPEIDTIAAASGNYYYESRTLTDEEVYAAIASFGAATVVSTVNRDHSPNASFVIPGFVEEGVLSFGLADNQTAENLRERDWAVITVLVSDPTIESPYEATKFRGARVVVEQITDQEEIDRLNEIAQPAYPGIIYVRVVEILPIG
jgi:hypothetical protein